MKVAFAYLDKITKLSLREVTNEITDPNNGIPHPNIPNSLRFLPIYSSQEARVADQIHDIISTTPEQLKEEIQKERPFMADHVNQAFTVATSLKKNMHLLCQSIAP